MILDQVVALGPFFAHEQHPLGTAPAAPWRSMSELLDDPAVLEDRVMTTRAYLAAAGGQDPEAVEVRVAASITHLGLIARLVSPALATSVLDAGVPPLDLGSVYWQPVLGGAFPLSLAPPSKSRDLTTEFFEGPVPALNQATQPFSVSDHILRGNVASAINGASVALSNAAPHLAGRAAETAAHLLAHPTLREAHTTTDGTFRRRSCCLIYRAAPDHAGALCGDCALAGDR
ncbi:FhuF-like iron-sulfur protein [Kribbella rubisoli]|uniref:FhuF-like iron-sulfur protein n=1 Tax=Kribbella rubisoli TaxID=3075929 RepID=A0A4Q7WNQ2_9ACTN|nr:(2Fe-2S)-binding protein [Kribbella rubisoli]RZU11145.1 FhuF-like iron-sulfur protein [Kribbella rubisoli]